MRTHLFLSTAQVFEGMFHKGDKGWSWPRLIPSPDTDTGSLHSPWDRLSSQRAPPATSKEKPSPWIPQRQLLREHSLLSSVRAEEGVCGPPGFQVFLLVEKEMFPGLAAAGMTLGVVCWGGMFHITSDGPLGTRRSSSLHFIGSLFKFAPLDKRGDSSHEASSSVPGLGRTATSIITQSWSRLRHKPDYKRIRFWGSPKAGSGGVPSTAFKGHDFLLHILYSWELPSQDPQHLELRVFTPLLPPAASHARNCCQHDGHSLAQKIAFLKSV